MYNRDTCSYLHYSSYKHSFPHFSQPLVFFPLRQKCGLCYRETGKSVNFSVLKEMEIYKLTLKTPSTNKHLFYCINNYMSKKYLSI